MALPEHPDKPLKQLTQAGVQVFISLNFVRQGVLRTVLLYSAHPVSQSGAWLMREKGARTLLINCTVMDAMQ